jgi:hypothetical protein
MTDVLFGLQQEFPGFRIWQERHGDRKRYVACRLFAGSRTPKSSLPSPAPASAAPHHARPAAAGWPDRTW